MAPELSVIIPAYNEAGAIGTVLETWSAALDRLGIDYELRVYDDGSTDGTLGTLRALAATMPRLVVTPQANQGHGPTVVRGYREARGEWVFQTDGDGESRPADFAGLWGCRDAYDFLIGFRVDRRAPLVRRVVTLGCRVATRLLFGSSIRDPNSPYRLMRRTRLVAMLETVPPRVFAPNAILSGLAARTGLRLCEIPVGWDARRAGTPSIGGWRVWKPALRSLRETVAVARGGRRPSR